MKLVGAIEDLGRDVVVVLNHTDQRDAPYLEGRHASDGPMAPVSAQSATIATAYDPADGHVVWERTLPFAAQVHESGAYAVVLVPAGVDPSGDGRLLALDPVTGSTVWETGLANPGRSGRYDLGDDVIDARYDEANDTLLVLVEAREPYRD